MSTADDPVQRLEHYGADTNARQPRKKRLLQNTGYIAAAITLVIVVVSLTHTPSGSAAPSAPAIVTITSKGLIPETLSIQTGQTVVWMNDDSHAHQIAADPYPTDNGGPAGFYDPVPLLEGQSYGFTFNKRGAYAYHDQLHPYTVKGTIIVKQ